MTANATNKATKFSVPLITGEDTYKINPDIFSGMVGQSEAVKKLDFFIASHCPKSPFPTMLFSGSQGLGKSYFAEKIAKALGREFVEINSAIVQKPKDFIQGVLMGRIFGESPKTILMDESHEMSDYVTTSFLTLLNPTKDNENDLAYLNWTVKWDLSKINVIFATTDAHKMDRPLLSRCQEIYFNLYSNDELFEILEQYTEGIEITCNQKDIAFACRGRARDAFVLAQNIKRFCIMKGKSKFTNNDWKELKKIFGIYDMGLRSQEIMMLEILKDSSPISCRNLAVRMGLNEDNIQSEIEVRPRELGFIETSSRGRELTPEGIAYLKDRDVRSSRVRQKARVR